MKTKFYRQVTTTPQLRSIDRWPKRHIIYWKSWNFSIKKSLGSPRPNLFFSDIESRSKSFGLRKWNGFSPIFVTWPLDFVRSCVFGLLIFIFSRFRWNRLIYKVEKNTFIKTYFFFKVKHIRKTIMLTLKQIKTLLKKIVYNLSFPSSPYIIIQN